MTYSFPCTDLSKAGKQLGMSRESGTRSGLLWEVERLLKETKELPQILLMENVPDILSEKNSNDFYSWCGFLEKLGYMSKYAILNAKDYGIPQNRERCFMISWLGNNYYYDFPEIMPLTKKLKDLLEKKVDKKYYLNNKAVTYITKRLGKYSQLCDNNTEYCKSAITAKGNQNWTGNFIKENAYRFYEQAFKTVKRNGIGIINNAKIRKLTPKECWRLMGFDDESFSRAEKVVSNSQLYKQAGNSIVVNVLMEIFKKLF